MSKKIAILLCPLLIAAAIFGAKRYFDLPDKMKSSENSQNEDVRRIEDEARRRLDPHSSSDSSNAKGREAKKRILYFKKSILGDTSDQKNTDPGGTDRRKD
ncbi:hypothetical protein JXJ21_21075 [candidate division KSB1 bacterium]|nr:hypothetical protein [candidate division KSB1 bacterium]